MALRAIALSASAIGALEYQGTWNASTNTPTLTSSVGTKGAYYVVSVAGTTDLNGEKIWGVGDWAVYNGSAWQKVDGGDTGNFNNLVVSGSTTAGNALVRIEQTGAGYALLVEDETNPDATPFAIHESGGVSIGNTLDAGAGNLYVAGNVAASIATLLTQLLVARSGGGEVMRLRGDSSVGAYPVLSFSINEAASAAFITISTVDTTTVGSLGFVGQNVTRWTMTTTGDFFPRQGSTGMKEGFSFIAGGSGAPTEVPTNENSGITPLYFDESNNRLYAYNSGWQYSSMAPSYITTEAGTTRTLTAADNNKVIYCTSGSAVTITTASGLGANFNCTIIQGGAGKVTVAQGASTTLVSYSSLYSTMGQYAVISLITPVADTFVAAGNLGV